MSSLPNPARLVILWIGLGLARLGLIDRDRARRTTDLAWPRIVTGVARMSKSAADVAMVGVALGRVAIAGVGFASAYWGLAFSFGGGFAAGTIALVSQRFGAEAYDELGQAVRSSVVVVLAVTVPLATGFWLLSGPLVALLSSDPDAIAYGAEYLRIVALGVPFAGLNLVGSRILIGADDAWTPMVLRGGGAVANILLNAVFIFYLGMGVVGAAWGTVLSNVLVTGTFAVGLAAGGLPLVGSFPLQLSWRGPYVDLPTVRDVVDIGTPVVGRNLVWTVARFPMLAIVGLFGSTVVSAYVIARRIWGLLNTPGWGFALAASSLVGQHLGAAEEATAEAYGREIVRFSTATYVLVAGLVALLAEPIVVLFVGDPTDAAVPIAVGLVYVGTVAIVPQGVSTTAAGALDATGDTDWPFYSRALGMFGVALPVAYLGATTSLGIVGIYLAFFGETLVPAAINYYRFTTGKWKAISRAYRPDAADD
ncbi:MATE family efflux transporter [Halobacteriales archaeon Cl-PHB]